MKLAIYLIGVPLLIIFYIIVVKIIKYLFNNKNF
jgi:hypothetical protein